MDYPILFEPLYKDYIWGGRKLAQLGKKLPGGIVAESWEIACHPAGTGIIANGDFSGMGLDRLLEIRGPEVLGSIVYSHSHGRFPLLIKLIDANGDLSVQVHPDDNYARTNENGELGKSEMWYIVDAEPGSKLVSGVKPGVTREMFQKAAADGTISSCLGYIDVKPGDCFDIPAGHVHAIGKGSLICEVQQNSNTTYRVYDYDRTDQSGKKRQLHMEKALDVIDFDSRGGNCKGLEISTKTCNRTYLKANKYFAAEHIELNGSVVEDTLGERFHCLTVLSGSIEINGTEVPGGHSCLIPASAGSYEVRGTARIIKSYVPDIEKDIIKPLSEAGFSMDEIAAVTG
ncbi:MAG: type I phosphomannose isomerase catalytic subunit [Clostridia bacterium]